MKPPLGAERLKALDGVLSRPAAHVGTGIAAITGRLRRRSTDPRPFIVRPGGLGDLIMCQIALEALGHDPRSVLWLIERRSAVWAERQGLPYLAYDDGLPSVLRKVAGRHKVVVNTEQHFGLSQAVAGAAVAAGGDCWVLDTNRAAHTARRTVAYDAYVEHEIRTMARLFAASLGGDPDGFALERRRAHPSDGTLLVAISGRQSATRSLALDRWIEHVEAWADARPVVVAAAPVDAGFADQLATRLGKGRARRFAGGFDELCDAIEGADAVLTVDGGPVHLASYAGTPVRAIFTGGRDRKWAPLAVGSQIARLPDGALACQPCTLFGQTPPCPHGLACHRMDAARDVRPAPD